MKKIGTEFMNSIPIFIENYIRLSTTCICLIILRVACLQSNRYTVCKRRCFIHHFIRGSNGDDSPEKDYAYQWGEFVSILYRGILNRIASSDDVIKSSISSQIIRKI